LNTVFKVRGFYFGIQAKKPLTQSFFKKALDAVILQKKPLTQSSFKKDHDAVILQKST
jgi:hypothetical protein